MSRMRLVRPPKGGFRAALVDYPWPYENWTAAKNGAASSAIKTMDVEDGMRIPFVKQGVFGKHSVMAFWATNPHLKDAMRIAEAWGFDEYVTCIPWVKALPRPDERIKVRNVVGFWSLGCSEQLLIFRRGKPTRKQTLRVKGLLVGDKADPVFWDDEYLQPGNQAVLWADVDRDHSAKPLGLHDWLLRILHGPHLELFGRRQVPGFEVWGYDVGVELGSFGARRVKVSARRRTDQDDGELPVIPPLKGEDRDQQFLWS